MRKRSSLAHAGLAAVAAVTVTMSSSRVVETQGGATIHVTSTLQGYANDGLCGLAEAIYAANFDVGVAPAGSGSTFVTGCEAGSGDDVIVLQPGAVYEMTAPVDDPYNPLGPTATPIVLTSITIEANGAELRRPNPTLDFMGLPNFRAFAVSFTSTTCRSADVPASTGQSLHACGVDPSEELGLGDSRGRLTIRNAYIRGFTSKGGDGAVGGGGGLGAGGAIYAAGGVLTVENVTFQHNGAGGGDGSLNFGRAGGGGGGLGGHGGVGTLGGGGGGGGSRGDGAEGEDDCGEPCLGLGSPGGGGGGTLLPGETRNAGGEPDAALRCGGKGGYWTSLPGEFFPNPLNSPRDGQSGTCPGGGGGGGRDSAFFLTEVSGGNGGDGAYGGGGGGGAHRMTRGDAGDGGFGGGGGGADGGSGNFPSGLGPSGGDGGFGGGGGAGHGGFISGGPGRGGSFAGSADAEHGGGGGALGGAIFGDNARINIINSTFYANYVVRGLSAGGEEASSGRGAGGAIFTVDGSLTVLNSTIYRNETTVDGGGLVVYRSTRDGFSASLTLLNTLFAQNTSLPGRGECYVLNTVDVVQAAGNLITNNEAHQLKHEFDGSPYNDPHACPGHVSSDDPQLQPLRLNAPGLTPTLAILATSPAADVADPSTSLGTDQRGVARPSLAGYDIGAYEAGLPQFLLDSQPFSDLFVALGESLSVPFTVSSADGFMDPVSLTVTTTSGLDVNVAPASVTPTPDLPASATLSILAGVSAVGGVHEVELRATAPDGVGRRIVMWVTVGVTPGGLAKTIDQLQLLGDITTLGVATSFTTKLSISEKLVERGELQAAVNTLAALEFQVRALRGRQISSAAADRLLANLELLMETVAPELTPNPLLGTVADGAGRPVADATVSIMSGKSTVTTTTTDAAGFYYVARTDWPAGSSFSVEVTLPKGYKRSTPSQLTFTWAGSQIELASFVLSK